MGKREFSLFIVIFGIILISGCTQNNESQEISAENEVSILEPIIPAEPESLAVESIAEQETELIEEQAHKPIIPAEPEIEETKPICGNRIVEESETMQTCCEDTGCLGEQICTSNKCTEPKCGECQYLEAHICKDYYCSSS